MNFMSGRSGGFYEEITSSDAGEFPPTYPYHRREPYSSSSAAPPPLDSSNVDESADNCEGSSTAAAAVIEREHMFDKVVTPSDVGKLNRLVIPKQHAEKYFPLDSSTHEKGLLLNFEDRNGKPWRFRYSYWNSSQSYVMTKGWSRFVKEKKLDAGDIVSFQRGVGELGKDRLFIDWRRRPDAPEIPPSIPSFPIPHDFSFHGSSIHPWSPLFVHPLSRSDYSRFLHPAADSAMAPPNPHYLQPPPYAAGPNYGYNNRVVNGNPCPPGSFLYLRSASGGSQAEPFTTQLRAAHPGEAQTVFNAVPVVQGKAAAKRLRLFGVNMDCPVSEYETISGNPTMPLPLPLLPPPSDDYSSPSSAAQDEKGKGSLSLDLDI